MTLHTPITAHERSKDGSCYIKCGEYESSHLIFDVACDWDMAQLIAKLLREHAARLASRHMSTSSPAMQTLPVPAAAGASATTAGNFTECGFIQFPAPVREPGYFSSDYSEEDAKISNAVAKHSLNITAARASGGTGGGA